MSNLVEHLDKLQNMEILGEQHMAALVGNKFYMIYCYRDEFYIQYGKAIISIHSVDYTGHTVLEWYGWTFRPNPTLKINTKDVITQEVPCTWEEWQEHKKDPLILLTLAMI
jgi:hypothetical protein